MYSLPQLQVLRNINQSQTYIMLSPKSNMSGSTTTLGLVRDKGTLRPSVRSDTLVSICPDLLASGVTRQIAMKSTQYERQRRASLGALCVHAKGMRWRWSESWSVFGFWVAKKVHYTAFPVLWLTSNIIRLHISIVPGFQYNTATYQRPFGQWSIVWYTSGRKCINNVWTINFFGKNLQTSIFKYVDIIFNTFVFLHYHHHFGWKTFIDI